MRPPAIPRRSLSFLLPPAGAGGLNAPYLLLRASVRAVLVAWSGGPGSVVVDTLERLRRNEAWALAAVCTLCET